jgi:hypothetical protein
VGLTAHDLLMNADVFRRAYPHWPHAEPDSWLTGDPQSAEEAMTTPMPAGEPDDYLYTPCPDCGAVTGEPCPPGCDYNPRTTPPAINGGTMTTDISAGETHTHRAWLDWADSCLAKLAELQQALDTMCASIDAADGDQAQIAAIRTWQAAIGDCETQGRQMVEEVNARQLPVGEAVAAAGGSANTPHAEYADEARAS